MEVCIREANNGYSKLIFFSHIGLRILDAGSLVFFSSFLAPEFFIWDTDEWSQWMRIPSLFFISWILSAEDSDARKKPMSFLPSDGLCTREAIIRLSKWEFSLYVLLRVSLFENPWLVWAYRSLRIFPPYCLSECRRVLDVILCLYACVQPGPFAVKLWVRRLP
jgi:hypothetical protein